MSTWFDETVACPQCKTSIAARLARGIHASRAPEVRGQILDRTFHQVKCHACGHVFTAGRAFVYTDSDRKHWVSVAPPNERVRWPEYEAATDALFDRAMTGSPLTHVIREGYTLRVVFGLEELREKLVIWSANLDDAVVECLKVHAISKQPELSRAEWITVDRVGGDGIELLVDRERRIALDRGLVDAFHDDERLRGRFPELFGGRFVSLFRLLGPRYRWAEPAT